MNINLTLLGTYLNISFWILGVILGTYVVHTIAREKVSHVGRSTFFGFLLSMMPPLVLIQILLLLKAKAKTPELEQVNL